MVWPDGMQRYAAVIEYHGGCFQGFQKQASTSNTVQALLEGALSMVANHPVTLVCAGRTDAGVHAARQVIHFDSPALRPVRAWIQGVNTKLPASIRVLACCPVSELFHARFAARARSYRYVTLVAPVPSAVLAGLVTWKKESLDVTAMRAAARHLLGEHDFSAFRASQCQAKNPVRTLLDIEVYQAGSFVIAEVRANAFLHHMVRNIMGALFEIGRGARGVEWMQLVLESRDRKINAATAPASGLYLVDVEYPPGFPLPNVTSGHEMMFGIGTR